MRLHFILPLFLAFGCFPAFAQSNDDFADAEELSGTLPLSDGPVDNGSATVEEDEADLVFDSIATNSLWWKWTATSTIDVEVNTSSSAFDTVLAVYKGSQVDDLYKIGSNDDLSSTIKQSRVRFTAISGEVYYFSVDGFHTVST